MYLYIWKISQHMVTKLYSWCQDVLNLKVKEIMRSEEEKKIGVTSPRGSEEAIVNCEKLSEIFVNNACKLL